MVVDGEPGAFAQGHMHNRDPNHRISHSERAHRKVMDHRHGVKKSFGTKHPEYLDHLVPLGHMLMSQGRLPEAEQTFQQCWEGRKAHWGENHPMTHRVLRELTMVKKRLGNKDEAETMLHSQSCHGFFSRNPSFSREQAASTRSTQDMGSSLRAAARMSLLQQELATTMEPGRVRSFSDSILVTARSSSKRQSGRMSRASSFADPISACKGRRAEGDAAEKIIRDFGDVLLAKYGSFAGAFKAMDKNGIGFLTSSEFASQARHIFHGDVTTVFKVLDAKHRGSVSMEDFQIFTRLPPEPGTMEVRFSIGSSKTLPNFP